MEDEILTTDEAAVLLKVEPKVVDELLCAGDLAGRIVGDEWRTTKRALLSYVDGAPIQVACCTPGDGGCC